MMSKYIGAKHYCSVNISMWPLKMFILMLLNISYMILQQIHVCEKNVPYKILTEQ